MPLYLAAKLQIKIERTKKKGEKLASFSLDYNELIKKLCNIVHVAPSGENELYRAFEIESPDFEDILQYSSAITVGAEVLLTRNDKHFRFSSIAVMDCETFINSL